MFTAVGKEFMVRYLPL